MNSIKAIEEQYLNTPFKVSANKDPTQFKSMLNNLYNLNRAYKCRALPRPMIIKKKDYQDVSHGVLSLISAQKKILMQLLADYSKNDLMRFFGLPSNLMELINWDLDSGRYLSIARADVIPHKEGYSICEINVHPSVGGMMHAHVVEQAIQESSRCLHRIIAQQTPYSLLAAQLANLIQKQGFHRLIILEWSAHRAKGYPHLKIMEAVFKSEIPNIQVIRCNELTYPEELLTKDKGQNTLVYRSFSLDEITDDLNFLNKIVTAGSTILNLFESELLTNKKWLALYKDNKYRKALSLSELDAIDKYIPETSLLNSLNIEYFLDHKDNYIFKHTGGFGGESIMIGKESTRDSLKLTLMDQNIEDWIAQQYIEAKSITFSTQTTSVSETYKLVLGLFAFNGVTSGFSVRGSNHSNIVNVTSGSAQTNWAFPIDDDKLKYLISNLTGDNESIIPEKT